MEQLVEVTMNGVISVLVVVLGLLFAGVREFIIAKAKEVKEKTTAEQYRTLQLIAMSVVQATEQIYKALHGDEKLNQAMSLFLAEARTRGLAVTDVQAKTLIESAVKEMNDTTMTLLDVVTES